MPGTSQMYHPIQLCFLDDIEDNTNIAQKFGIKAHPQVKKRSDVVDILKSYI